MSAAQLQRFAPASGAELVETMRELAATNEVVSITGGGTKAGWGHPVRDRSAEISTANLNRILEHAPEDLVVTVEAGMTLGALQTELAKAGQRLAYDPPQADRATIGGLVATGDFGQRRVRYGGIRDLIIGVQFVQADGAFVRGGGKVVKNVAGFDLPKILSGSFGTLGVIAAATFRLHPVPETAAMVTANACTGSQVREAARIVAREQLEPAVLLAVREEAGYTAALVFEGFASGVDEQAARAVDALNAAGFTAQRVDPAERARVHAAHGLARTHGNLRVKIVTPPASIEAIERDALVPLLGALGEAGAALYPSLGVAFAGGNVVDDAQALHVLQRSRAFAEQAGGTLIVRDMPDAVRSAFDPWGTPPPSLFLMERLKARFDPQHRLNRGRFVGGL
jgi:glycolate oxidase FAD binding subunit